MEDTAGALVTGGIFYYTKQVLDYPGAWNLALAMTFGLAYVAGASVSGRVSRRLPEKWILIAALATQATIYSAMFALPHGMMLAAGMALAGAILGIKWPVIESYISAGLTQREASRAIGRFNMTWATAVPFTMVLAGPLVEFTRRGIFLVAAATAVANLLLSRPLPYRPVHLPHDHPDRPDAKQLRRCRHLLASGRWTMVSSYAMVKVLDPLMPGVFAGMGLRALYAAPLWSLFGWARLATFVTMRHFTGWHGRRHLPLAAVIMLPTGFFLALLGPGLIQALTGTPAANMLGPSLAVVLGGAVLVGLAAGISYYASLYYGMVVHNASVDASGRHELAIGLAFTAGPAVGLGGAKLAGVLAAFVPGYLLTTGPFALLCAAGAVRSLLKTPPRAGPEALHPAPSEQQQP